MGTGVESQDDGDGRRIEELVAQGLSVAQMAARTLLSPRRIRSYMACLGFGDFAALNARDEAGMRTVLEDLGSIKRVADYHGVRTETAVALYRRRGVHGLETAGDAYGAMTMDEDDDEQSSGLPVISHLHYLTTAEGGAYSFESLANVFKRPASELRAMVEEYIAAISKPLPDDLISALRSGASSFTNVMIPAPLPYAPVDTGLSYGRFMTPPGMEALILEHKRARQVAAFSRHTLRTDPPMPSEAAMTAALGPRLRGRRGRRPTSTQMEWCVAHRMSLDAVAAYFGVKTAGIAAHYNRTRSAQGLR